MKPGGSIWFMEGSVTPQLRTKRNQWPLRPVQRGFSLVEVMAVIAIIVMLGAVSIPSIRSGMSHLKFARALDSFVNQVEFARSQAASRNRAYRVQVFKGEGLTRGRVIVTEGWGTLCNQTNFIVSGGFKPVEFVRDVDFTTEHPWVNISSVLPIGIIPQSESDYQGLCFKPDGRVMQIATLGGGTLLPLTEGYGAGEALFHLNLLGEQSDMARVVVVPYNGIPRVEQP